MALNLTNASNVLKVFYRGPIREQLNGSTILLSRIEREDDVKAVGKTFTVPLRTGRNQSAGAGRVDGGTLPTNGNQAYSVLTIPNKYVYGQIRVTGPTIAASRTDAGSFVRALDSEIRGLTRDFKRSINRQMHSDGTDALAFWTAADNTSGTDVDDGQGNAFVHLETQAMTLDLIDATDHTTKLGDSIVVTLGAESATVFAITWTGSVSGSADGDYLTMEDTIGSQMMGIRGIISASDPPDAGGGLSSGLHGLAVASNAWWKAQDYNNSGTNRALSLALMQKPLSAIAVKSDFEERDVKFLLGNVYIRDEYIKLLVADKRFVNTLQLDGGFEGVDFNGKPFVVDPQCRRNVIYYVTPASMKIFRTSDFDWMERDGSMFSRVNNTDAYEATMFHYGDLAVTARNANGILADITES